MLKQITSLQHPAIKHLVKLRQNRDYRYEHHSLVIEGIKMVGELPKRVEVKLVMALDETLIPKTLAAKEVLIVSEEVFQKTSGLQHPEGILAEVMMPGPSTLSGLKYILALDGVNDPGNLGTLLRTALALGWEGAFILNESCDPYNEKAVRASRGATFHLPLGMGNFETLARIQKENQLKLLVADLEGKPAEHYRDEKGLLLILSSEAHGPSIHFLDAAEKVTVPMQGPMESLNVAIAGGILMQQLIPLRKGNRAGPSS